MVKCSNCNYEAGDGNFCPNCGTKIIKNPSFGQENNDEPDIIDNIIDFDDENCDIALEYVDKILKSDPKNVQALMTKARILSSQGNPECKQYYEKIIEIYPDNIEAKIGISVIESVADISNPQKASYWLDKAMKESWRGEHLNAIDSINKAIDIDPNHSYAWNRLSVEYQYLKDYSSALFAINKALQLNPNMGENWYHAGQILFWLGEFEEAINSFDISLEIGNDNISDTFAIKGMAFIKLNNMDEAIKCLRKSLEIDPNNEYALETIKHMHNEFKFFR